MAKSNRHKEPDYIPMDKRIRRILDDSWITPVYFNAAITELLNKFNAMSDEELNKYMERIISAKVARNHVREIYCRLNNIKYEPETARAETAVSETEGTLRSDENRD